MIRVALAQINVTVGDFKGNLTKICNNIKRAEESGADIVIFPEMALCGYPPEDLLYKEDFVEDNEKFIKALARKVGNLTAVVGFVHQDKKKNLFNAAAVIHGRKIKGFYHKASLPNYGVFDEKRYFTAGDKNPMFRCGKCVLGINICEDIWPEDGVWKEQIKKGAKVLLNLSSSPYEMDKLRQREKLLVDRAKKNKAYVCYVNLVGGQDELVFDGGSLVVGPDGKAIARGKEFEEDLILVDLDDEKKVSRKKFVGRNISLPKATQDKQLILTSESKRLNALERIYHALVLGTQDYVYKNKFQKVVVGLSGGIDSSLVAVIAVDAIGRHNVAGIAMPSQFSSQGTKTDAKILAGNLGIRFLEVPIQNIYESYLKTVSPDFSGLGVNAAEENIQARIRGNILMAYSNKFGWLVLTTGNKSEIAVGYCTLYGDMSGGFAVINDVPKTVVYDLARLINSKNNQVIPESILDRAPTAELKENQKDQDVLPAYADLDMVIKGYVEEHLPYKQLLKKGPAQEIINSIMRMVDNSEYKRRQAPPGIKITPRAFGKDWRVPITNKYCKY